VKSDLGGELLTRPTDSVLADYKTGIYNVSLENIYFQYGRYLMISCSRPGLALPSNLQGIWCNSNNPPWQSDIHSNINVQMNYWPAEVTNLSECHLPYLDYIYNLAAVHPYWTNYAKELGHRGWTMKTENNIFGLSGWKWNCPSNAWYSMHMWQHYAYTLDTVFLKTRAYPIMKTACEFWIDRMIKDTDGKWVAPNEWSPEHGPWEDGPAFAQQLIWDLFTNTIQAASVLQIRDDFTDTLILKYSHLNNGLAIGEWGQLKEWKTTEDDPDNKHRHISHMIGLYPGKQISPVIDTLYANAAKISLNARGDITTGWATTHRINAWARLHDGDRALSIFRNYLLGGMTLDNLFDTHPPFQIDGNFGGTTGVATMLIQCFNDRIYILPALPSAWPTGSITGLVAERGFVIDIAWNNNMPVEVKVISKFGLPCNLVMKDYENIEVFDQQNNPVGIIIGDEGGIGFDTKSEGVYYVKIF
jgi:alpha-L-fucosidase 2